MSGNPAHNVGRLRSSLEAMFVRSEKSSPSTDSINQIAETSRIIVSCSDDSSSWLDTYVGYHKERVAFDLDYTIEFADQENKILDVGAAPYLLTGALRARGFNVSPIDIGPERFSDVIYKLGIQVVKCDIEQQTMPFDSCHFDVIIFNELFEHLRINLIFTMSEVHRVLKPGGMLMLSTPNLKSLGGIVKFLFSDKSYSCASDIYHEFEELSKLGHMGHMREYTPKEVVIFLSKIGFLCKGLIFRGRYDNRLARYVINLRPKFKPFVSIICTKLFNAP